MIEFKDLTKTNSVTFTSIGEIKFKTGRVYLLYGDTLSGKTWIACWLSRKIAQEDKVIFLDTEGKSSRWFRKWSDMGIIDEDILGNILLKEVINPDEFEKIVDNIEKIVEDNNASALVIDTIISPYEELHPMRRAMKIRKITNKIREMVRDKSLLTMITTQTYRNGHRGGQALYNYSDHQLSIRQAEKKKEMLMDRRRIIRFDERKEFMVKVEQGELKLVD